MAVFVAGYHLKMTFMWFISSISNSLIVVFFCYLSSLVLLSAFTCEDPGFILSGVHNNKNDKKDKYELGAFPTKPR